MGRNRGRGKFPATNRPFSPLHSNPVLGRFARRLKRRIDAKESVPLADPRTERDAARRRRHEFDRAEQSEARGEHTSVQGHRHGRIVLRDRRDGKRAPQARDQRRTRSEEVGGSVYEPGKFVPAIRRFPIPLEARIIDDCGAPVTSGSVSRLAIQPVSQGALISIFGSNLAQGLVQSHSLPLAVCVAGPNQRDCALPIPGE